MPDASAMLPVKLRVETMSGQNNGAVNGSRNYATDFKPIKFVAERTEEACFCLCKSTSQPPYCDGTHNHIE